MDINVIDGQEAAALSGEKGVLLEARLIDNAPVLGRKTELRQLLKLVTLSRQGQGRSALVLGDRGTGKTALLDTLTHMIQTAIYSRVVRLGQREALQTPQQLYVDLLNAIRDDARQILADALQAVNELLAAVDLRWEAQDLARAVSLVQLNESLTPAASYQYAHDELFKALKNSVPTVKKMRQSSTEHLEKLVHLILNPWVISAVALTNPIDRSLQAAFALAEEIEAGGHRLTPGWVHQRADGAPAGDAAASQRASVFFDKVETEVLEVLSPLPDHTPALEAVTLALSGSNAEGKPATPVTVLAPARPDADRLGAPPPGRLGQLLQSLVHVLGFVNQQIGSIDSSLVVLIDRWESLHDADVIDRQDVKLLLSETLARTTELGNMRLLFILACDSDRQSQTLGGPLFQQLRHKILLPDLDENTARRLLKKIAGKTGLEFAEAVCQKIYRLSQGNPYWQQKAVRYVIERAQANRVQNIDLDFYDRLCVDQPQDLLELTYTRLRLAFLHQEGDLDKVLAAFVKTYPNQWVERGQAMRELSLSQQLPENFVFEVLQRMIQHDFLDKRSAPLRNETEIRLQGQQEQSFLAAKTLLVQTDISTEEKLHYLKKVIPLSIQSGELDRAKTQEVLALCHALGQQDMVAYLEQLFLDALESGKPAVRVTALNNLSLIDTQAARNALFVSLHDDDAMVREYAAKNIYEVSQRSTDPAFHRLVVDQMLECLDDEYEAVRAQVYLILSKYRWSNDLMPVFIKGLSDADITVRALSAKNLADIDTESPFLRNALLDALDDPASDVRRYACMGVQRFSGEDVVNALITRLQYDDDSAIRALAADLLGQMENSAALQSLRATLGNPRESEDVKLAIVRALGKRRCWAHEELLLDFIADSDAPPPALLWTAVKSLGQVGGTDRSIHTLLSLREQVDNEIIQSTAQLALKKIKRRIEELHQLERQLEEATPTATAIPAEYQQDVTLPTDEWIQT